MIIDIRPQVHRLTIFFEAHGFGITDTQAPGPTPRQGHLPGMLHTRQQNLALICVLDLNPGIRLQAHLQHRRTRRHRDGRRRRR